MKLTREGKKPYGCDDFFREAEEKGLTIHDILPAIKRRLAEIEAPQSIESSVAPGECGSVPDERAKFEVWARPAGFDNLILSGDDYFWPPAHYAWKAWQARASLGMQPPNNQPNSDHVAVISAEPESRLTAAEDMPIVVWYRTERDITEEYFTNYSEGPDRPDGEGWKPLCDPQAMMAEQFRRAVEGPQSGISSPTHRPNEQNDAVQEGKQ